MRCAVLLLLVASTVAQNAAQNAQRAVTVPVVLDHNRVTVDVDLSLPDGSSARIRGWLDNGNPDLELSRHAATLLGLAVTCNDAACSAPPPREITIGGMKISLAAVKEAHIPLKPVAAARVMAPGMNAEINIPSMVLRNYDVIVSFPDRELTIGPPGSLKFKGIKAKVMVNSGNGLVQVPSEIANKKYNLALDLGSSMSFLAPELFDKLEAAHPSWPHMAGAIGPANMWGEDDELKRKLMRVDRVQFGPLFFTNAAVAEFSPDQIAFFEKRAGISTGGLLSANALTNYRVGFDYAHSTVYFDIGRLFNFPDFDVIGLILRPEDDGRFTILGTADYGGKSSVPEVQAGDRLLAVDGIPVAGSTLGQVWSMLGGEPGKERSLAIERGGKRLNILAKVQHFLAETE